MSPGATTLLACLRSFGQQIFPRQATLAGKLGVGVRTVNRHMRELKKAGVVEVETRGPSSSCYRLIPQQVEEQFGVASTDTEFSTELVENPVEKLWNGVACGVAFGVALPPHLLLRGLSSSFSSSVERVVVSDCGCLKNPDEGKNPAASEPRGMVRRETRRRAASEPSETPCGSLAAGDVSTVRVMARPRSPGALVDRGSSPVPPKRPVPEIHLALAELIRAKSVGGSP